MKKETSYEMYGHDWITFEGLKLSLNKVNRVVSGLVAKSEVQGKKRLVWIKAEILAWIGK